MVISDKKWIIIGNMFCVVRRAFINKYKEIYPKLTKKQKNTYNKYYIYFFNSLADIFDDIICNYYTEDIETIEGLEITKIFYNDIDDDYNYNNKELKMLYTDFIKNITFFNGINNNIFDNIIIFNNIKEKQLLELIN